MSRAIKTVALLSVLAIAVVLLVNVEWLTSVFSENSLKAFLESGNITITVLFTLAAGFLTALSPCVYPIIPITLSVIGTRRYESAMQGFLVSLSYVAGMVALYVSLGILFSSVGILFGAVYQYPPVLLAVGVLFLFFALSMLGVLNWILPDSLLKRLSTIGGSGIRGAFLMGLVSGLIASPCTGPVLAFILTLISRQGDIWSGSVLMIVYGIGMGIPFLILGTFSSAVTRVPKSGSWMNVIKVLFTVCMLFASSYYFYLGIKGIISQRETPISDPYAKLEADLAAAKEDKVPVVIDFFADWCSACKEIESVTLQNPKVAKRLTAFKVLRIDITNLSPSVTRIMEKFEITGLPLIVFFNEKGVLLEKLSINGFINPDQFLIRLDAVQKKSPG